MAYGPDQRKPVFSAEVALEIGITLAEANRRLILATLRACGGDKKSAAGLLGVSVKTLYNRLRTYGVYPGPLATTAGAASSSPHRPPQRPPRSPSARASSRRDRSRSL